jgi:hypothetical protein
MRTYLTVGETFRIRGGLDPGAIREVANVNGIAVDLMTSSRVLDPLVLLLTERKRREMQ